MRVQSFMRQGLELVPIEVELVLSPGLPRIQVIGLPDAVIKESALRIRSAIRKQGFRLPRGQQVLVHLKPNHLRKTSRGLDLAIAAALLWETKQIPYPKDSGSIYLYGELSLTGEVETPEDLSEIPYIESSVLYSGEDARSCILPCFRLKNLRDLESPGLLCEPSFELQQVTRPKPLMSFYSPQAALVAEVVSAGEHSALFAGPAGSGKSTLAASIQSWIEEPNSEEAFRESLNWSRAASLPVWRPFVRPHHTITKIAMIGGGNSASKGEVSRAHEGILLMDELLEFDPEIQESLREPIENGFIRIVRSNHVRTYPARVLILATTNLCACGKFVPKKTSIKKCRCSNAVKAKYLRRLVGPFVDRFAILEYSDTWGALTAKTGVRISAEEILKRVERAIRFRKEMREQHVPNAYLEYEAIEGTLGKTLKAELDEVLGDASLRRKLAVLRVARTVADLRESGAIELSDFDSALDLSWKGHRLLEDWGAI